MSGVILTRVSIVSLSAFREDGRAICWAGDVQRTRVWQNPNRPRSETCEAQTC